MKKSEWTRVAVIFAVVTIAISQIAFNLVLRNVRGTPSHWLFYFWTIHRFASHSNASDRTMSERFCGTYGYFLEGGLGKNVLFTPHYHMTLHDEMAYVLQNINAGTAQYIYWHISIPHSPFIFDHDGRLSDGGSSYFPIPGTPLRVNYQEAVVKYIEQVRYADLVLGKILNQLKVRTSMKTQ